MRRRSQSIVVKGAASDIFTSRCTFPQEQDAARSKFMLRANELRNKAPVFSVTTFEGQRVVKSPA